MKLLLYLAGLVSGIVAYHLYLVIALFRKSAQPTDEFHEWTEEDIELFQSMTDDAKIAEREAAFADTQPIEVLGVYDRVLTDKEIQKVYEAGEEGIRKSFADTQPIKVDTDEVGAWDLDYWGNYVK